MQKKKIKSLIGLIVILTGIIIIPSLHLLDLSHSETSQASHSDCCCNNQKSSAENQQSDRHKKEHHSSDCPICKFINAPIDYTNTDLYVSPVKQSSSVIRISLANPSFKTEYLLPYPLGPPASSLLF